MANSPDKSVNDTTMTIKSLIYFRGRNRTKLSLTVLYILLIVTHGFSSKVLAPKVKLVPPVIVGADGLMAYTADARGNRVPDFSYCGYKAS